MFYMLFLNTETLKSIPETLYFPPLRKDISATIQPIWVKFLVLVELSLMSEMSDRIWCRVNCHNLRKKKRSQFSS